MTNKDLLQRLESGTTGCFINQMIYIPSEIFTEGYPTRAMEDFENQDNKEICKILGFDYTEDLGRRVDGYINTENREENLCHFLILKNKVGFLAEVHFPHHFRFNVKEDGSRGSSWVSRQQCNMEWVYGDSIQEIVEKMINGTEKWIEYDFKQEQLTTKS